MARGRGIGEGHVEVKEEAGRVQDRKTDATSLTDFRDYRRPRLGEVFAPRGAVGLVMDGPTHCWVHLQAFTVVRRRPCSGDG